MIPSIPEGGTKSRVETQVRLTVDLAHASASSGEPLKYDRVGSWKWLRLPKGTSTKRRARKEAKIGEQRHPPFSRLSRLRPISQCLRWRFKMHPPKIRFILPRRSLVHLHRTLVLRAVLAVKDVKYASNSRHFVSASN